MHIGSGSGNVVSKKEKLVTVVLEIVVW